MGKERDTAGKGTEGLQRLPQLRHSYTDSCLVTNCRDFM